MLASSPQKKRQKITARAKNYRRFDECTKTIRDGVVTSCAKTYMQHLKENNGKCKRGFMKSLIDKAVATAPTLGITRDDVKNEVKRVQKKNVSNKISPNETIQAKCSVEKSKLAPGLVLLSEVAATSPLNESSSIMPSKCSWPNCRACENPPDNCCVCGTSVHWLCQAEAELANSWMPHVESKLFCLLHHPNNPDKSTPALSNSPTVAAVSDEASTRPSTTEASDQTAIAVLFQPQPRNKGGRPVGSTQEKKMNDELIRKQAVNWVVTEYAKVRQEIIATLPSTTKK